MGKRSSKTKAPNPSRTPPPSLKKHLIEEAGYKCANPGCSNRLIEIHHIKEWCIYYTHDKAHMIAVCPACHDTVTRGNLRIDDETLYRWKNIIRGELNHDHIYVERGSPVRMLFGSITVEAARGSLIVFDLPNNNKLSLEIIDSDIAMIDLVIKALDGNTIIKMSKNYIEYKLKEGIDIRRRPGKFQLVLTDQALNLVPSWITQQHLRIDTDYFATHEHILIDIEVLEPGLVRMYGIWMDKEIAVVSSPVGLSFIRRNGTLPLTFVGEGTKSIIKCISVRLFDLLPTT